MHLLPLEQEMFCNYLLQGDTQIKAYKKAYKLDLSGENTSKDYSNASLLAKKPEILRRLSELQENTDLWSKEQAVKTLLEVIEEGNPTATLNAVKQLNTMYGFTEAKIEEESINSIEIAIVPTIGMLELHED